MRNVHPPAISDGMPWSLRAGRLLLVPLALALGLAFAPLGGALARAASRPRGPIVLAVGGPTTTQAIAPGFLGLSLEYWALPGYAGSNPSAVDPVFVQLIRNLAGWLPTPASDRRVHHRHHMAAEARTRETGGRVLRPDPPLDRRRPVARDDVGGAIDPRDQPRGGQPDRRRGGSERARTRYRPRADRGARARQRARAVRSVHVGNLERDRPSAGLWLLRLRERLHSDRAGTPGRPARGAEPRRWRDRHARLVPVPRPVPI